MIFWDSSALVALLVTEPESPMRLAQLQSDPQMAVWWATPVEIESALQRRLREASLDAQATRLARNRLAMLSQSWHEVNPHPNLRKLALRVLRTHALRAADSLQLAAALTLDGASAMNLSFACADIRLATAAEVEGLPLVV
jgi:predicted nucleic acid-binding protein